jgi:hypothetical protein
MGDIIDLQKLRNDQQLVSDCARYGEGLFSEPDVRKRHHLPESVWDALGSDDLFVEKVEAEKLRRVRNGNAKRERAQQHITKAPDILASIMEDPGQSARHRIDSAKVLDTFAANGPEAAPPEDKFTIVINLGGDEKLVFSKSRTPNPHDDVDVIEHDSNDDTAPGWIPAIADKSNNSPGGEGAPW